jgi:hypothetical protein
VPRRGVDLGRRRVSAGPRSQPRSRSTRGRAPLTPPNSAASRSPDGGQVHVVGGVQKLANVMRDRNRHRLPLSVGVIG